MPYASGSVPFAGLLTSLAVSLLAIGSAPAQTPSGEFVTGRAAEAWSVWQPAMQAVLDRNAGEAERLFGELLEQGPSPFRIALLRHRTVSKTSLGGALTLLSQDAEAGSLGENGQAVMELLERGDEQMLEASDGWYFASVGRFDVSNANFKALLGADPDPVALLEFTELENKRRDVLLQLTDNAIVGDAAHDILRLLDLGERIVKADPTRIKANIERLGGPPRAYENGEAWLKQSGEYAIPFMVEYLRDSKWRHLAGPILRALPQIDRPALNPLVIAIRVPDTAVEIELVRALGHIGYRQALPYLLQLHENAQTTDELASAVDAALNDLRAKGTGFAGDLSAADAFFDLAEAYYGDTPSLAADPRLDFANVWYWRDDLLQNIPVPTQIFNEVMTMRCCEEALRLDPQRKDAQALWVAADFRREAQLREGEIDATRPENYPSAKYFAQTAGPAVCLMTLARALDDGDPAVALGAIEALHNTAGPASLIADEGGRLPLAEALSFPDRMVRIRAALALGAAKPTQPFLNHQNFMPVIIEALRLFGGARDALVVDPDEASANTIAGFLRAAGYDVIVDTELYRGLQKVRDETTALEVIFLGADMKEPDLRSGLAQLRDEFRFAATPVVLVTKPGTHELVNDLVRADHRLGEVTPNADPARMLEVVTRISRAVGIQQITPEVGTALALEATQTLLQLAEANNTLFDIGEAQDAVIATLASDSNELRLAAAAVLGYLPQRAAQEAIAAIALDPAEAEEMRVAMFGALARAAKLSGNNLSDDSVAKIVAMAQTEENLTLRTAASGVLGALNLSSDLGSEIIRNQYGG